MIVLIVKLSLTSYTDGHMPLLPNKLKQTGKNNTGAMSISLNIIMMKGEVLQDHIPREINTKN